MPSGLSGGVETQMHVTSSPMRDLDAPAHVVVVILLVGAGPERAARQVDRLDHVLVELDIFAGIVPATIDDDGRGRKGRPVAHALGVRLPKSDRAVSDRFR